MFREARERECNIRENSVGGIIKEITNLGKDLERYQDKVVTYGSTLTYAGDKICRTASDIKGVRDWSKGANDDLKDAVDRGRGGVG